MDLKTGSLRVRPAVLGEEGFQLARAPLGKTCGGEAGERLRRRAALPVGPGRPACLHPCAVQAAIAKYDNLGPSVTTSMALSGYPVGPVSVARIQRVAAAMLEFGFLGRQYAAGVEQGTLVKSMIGSAS